MRLLVEECIDFVLQGISLSNPNFIEQPPTSSFPVVARKKGDLGKMTAATQEIELQAP